MPGSDVPDGGRDGAAAVARTPGDPDLYRAIARVWEFGRRSGPRHFVPGVHRYRSLAELNAQVERWAIEFGDR